MHFIESLFNASPDQESGLLEFCLLFFSSIMFAFRVWWKQSSRSNVISVHTKSARQAEHCKDSIRAPLPREGFLGS
jgi:hypothetical protein